MLNFHDDAAAFRAFIAEHQNRVFNVVLNKVQNVHDAEDITQDVFVDVYRKPGAFRGEAAISTWLYRIAMNKCIDHLRRKKYRQNPSVENEPADFVHPGIVSENREKAAFLYRAMKQLPDKQQTAWVLSEMENLSYKEISEIMNRSVSSVESLIFRARQNLKKILSELYPNTEL